MKRVAKGVLAVLSLIILSVSSVVSQNTLSSKSMIAITPLVCNSLELDNTSKQMLNMKLLQIVTANGFSSTSCRYALVPNVVIINKQIAPTVPAMYSIEFELSLYVVDVVEDIVISETSISLKGLDRVEGRAYNSAFNQISPRSPQMQVFMDKSRSSILDYYATRTMTLLKKAETLAEQERYDEAMEVLTPIPESVDEYAIVADAMVAIYKKRLDKDAKVLMQKAHTFAATEKFDEAIETLLQVVPASNYWDDANKEIDSIIKTMEEKKRVALEAEKVRLEAQIAKAKELTAQKELEAQQQERNIAETIRQEEASKSSMDKFSEKVNAWFVKTLKIKK